jgi:hypothetical protein
MAAKLALVREARTKLEDKHFAWMIDAAYEHFVSSAKKTECDIVRYQGLPDAPIFTPYGKDRGPDLRGTTRERELPKLRASLNEYYAILEFLQALKDAEVVRSAEAFAAEFDWRAVVAPAPRGRGGGTP